MMKHFTRTPEIAFRVAAAVAFLMATSTARPVLAQDPAVGIAPQCGAIISQFDRYLRETGLAVQAAEYDVVERQNFMDAYNNRGTSKHYVVDRLVEYQSAAAEGMSIVVGTYESCLVFEIVAPARLVEHMKTGILVGRTP